MNRLSFRRMAGDYDLDQTFHLDIAVPVVDGTPLHELVGERFYGIDASLVAPPSPHLLRGPKYVEDGRTVLLDGDCLSAGCCGVMARVVIDDRAVRWADFFARGRPPLPNGLSFEFDRVQYETALASFDHVPVEPLPQSNEG